MYLKTLAIFYQKKPTNNKSFLLEENIQEGRVGKMRQLNLFHSEDHLSIKEASLWASNYLGKTVSTANISYLIQYGRVKKRGQNGSTYISKQELINYYKAEKQSVERSWKDKLGNDLNWALSFEQYKESETTKHVHRLHPYKGKFIPQLVEYFLDSHTDNFKKSTFFKTGDIVLDPFSGSGTTMIQACELGIHSIGIDISAFNTIISNCKVEEYDLEKLQIEINKITNEFHSYLQKTDIADFEQELLQELYNFNNQYFPVPDYKYKVKRKQIDEKEYGKEKEEIFLPTFQKLVKKYKIQIYQSGQSSFLDKWYFQNTRNEIDFIYNKIQKIKNKKNRNIISLILSRTIRSCRATTHSDLATLLEPITTTYYCKKHGKICKPLFSIAKWWNTYTKDTVKRIQEFHELRKSPLHICLNGDSRKINIIKELDKIHPEFAALANTQKIKGIFSSPPYVGLIDYHEQHAYAYELLGLKRHDNLEIGPLSKGQSKNAKEEYANGVSKVLMNAKKYLVKNFDIFLVANDKYNLYPMIADNAGLKIVNRFKRPVLNRTEKDKNAYSEIIFHMKGK